jgi:hypothetical protein
MQSPQATPNHVSRLANTITIINICLLPIAITAISQKHLASTAAQPAAAAAAAPQVTAVLFACPNVGDAAFSADFNSRINARSISFTADMFPQMPCVGSQVDCTASTAAAPGDQITGNFAAQGEQLTRNSSVIGSLPYDSLGGRMTLTANDMPHQKEAWSQLSFYTQVSDPTISFCNNKR